MIFLKKEKSNWPTKGTLEQLTYGIHHGKNSFEGTTLTQEGLREFLRDLTKMPSRHKEDNPWRPMLADECQKYFGKFVKKLPFSHSIITENNIVVRYWIHNKKVYYYLMYAVWEDNE